MNFSEFLTHCTACGGNWTAMLMSGIKTVFPEHFAQMEDKEYSFEDLFDELLKCGVIID